MTTKQDIADRILHGRLGEPGESGSAFAPANIALCKYWGKRDTELNLPVTSSLSLSLGGLGSKTRLVLAGEVDEVVLNGERLAGDHPFVERASRFLDLFRGEGGNHYRLETTNTIPTAAGFASSASGFASLVLALDRLHGWALLPHGLSILARLGSGSACRSFWDGFAEWHAGTSADGMDSFAEPFASDWRDLRIGLLVLEAGPKPIGSRPAMQRTVETSALYRAWPEKVSHDLGELKTAIAERDFERLGSTAESNALAMHATMMAARPAVVYWQPESVAAMHEVWRAREAGIDVYFTMDAGPNIKLLFTDRDEEAVLTCFPALNIVDPWETTG